MRRLAVLALAAAGLVVPAAAAHAAYAPALEVRVDPATPDTASALTATLRQAPGESANRDEVVRFPPAFRFNPGFSVNGCTAAQEADAACPDASRIGLATADTELGAFSGAIHLTQDFRFLIFLRGFGGLVQQKIDGYFRMGADGWIESVIEGLPQVRSTVAQVRMDAGARSLMLTPAECGQYPVDGRFTSHQGETATSRATVTIAGCERPAIAALRARARRGRIDAAWTLTSAAARTEVVLERRVWTRPWVRWTRVRASARTAAAGPARTVLSGPRGARLRAGRYRMTLTAYGPGGTLADMRRVEVTLPG